MDTIDNGQAPAPPVAAPPAAPDTQNPMAAVDTPLSMRDMMEAGVHFGHQTKRWNPKMKPYIFGRRNLIHIINLRETLRGLIVASKFVTHTVASGKSVVFVGTKRQARRVVQEQAVRCGMPFVIERWLGGTLTNFRTIRLRLDRLLELEAIFQSGTMDQYSKKEGSRMKRELAKIQRNLDGIRTMNNLPGAVIVIDPHREKNAVAEAQRLNIPTICLADTDCDPDTADILIPGNDDAMRSIEVTMRTLADAVLAGKERRTQRIEAEVVPMAPVPAAAAEKKAPEAPRVVRPATQPAGQSPQK
jgi:small subunit ribosomal protein S2